MRNGTFWIGMVVGAVVGAVLGMVYAPKPGEETRGQLGEGVKRLTDVAAQKGRGLFHRGRDESEESGGEEEQKSAQA